MNFLANGSLGLALFSIITAFSSDGLANIDNAKDVTASSVGDCDIGAVRLTPVDKGFKILVSQEAISLGASIRKGTKKVRCSLSFPLTLELGMRLSSVETKLGMFFQGWGDFNSRLSTEIKLNNGPSERVTEQRRQVGKESEWNIGNVKLSNSSVLGHEYLDTCEPESHVRIGFHAHTTTMSEDGAELVVTFPSHSDDGTWVEFGRIFVEPCQVDDDPGQGTEPEPGQS